MLAMGGVAAYRPPPHEPALTTTSRLPLGRAACLLLGWRVSRTNRIAGFVRAARLFLPLWLLSAAVNMWYAMTYGGHSFIQELPIFLLVLAIPAAAAMAIWWRVSLRLR